MGNYTRIKRPSDLYNATAATFFAVSTRVLPLLSPLLSRHRVLDSVQAGNFFKLSGQHIQRGHDRHKNFWHSQGYNFVSVKGMLLKLIQATILDSRNILDQVFLWLPVTRPSRGQLKNQNSQTFLLQKYVHVTGNCDTLQKYSAHKIEELVRFDFSNFIFVTSQ